MASCRRGVEARTTRMMGWCRVAEVATATGRGGYGRYPFFFLQMCSGNWTVLQLLLLAPIVFVE
ncbi:unnamed protein product [Prunus armeniaca]